MRGKDKGRARKGGQGEEIHKRKDWKNGPRERSTRGNGCGKYIRGSIKQELLWEWNREVRYWSEGE